LLTPRQGRPWRGRWERARPGAGRGRQRALGPRRLRQRGKVARAVLGTCGYPDGLSAPEAPAQSALPRCGCAGPAAGVPPA